MREAKEVWTRTQYQNGYKYTYYYVFDREEPVTKEYNHNKGDYVKCGITTRRIYRKVGCIKEIVDQELYDKTDHKRGPKFKNNKTN